MNDVIAQVLQIQNEDTSLLAPALVEASVRFRETKDFSAFVDILILIDRTLLSNGVFLRDFLDALEETGYIKYN